ncbi:biotin transporter BioY [Roseicyclus sp. F158]|uniref:Biotin transporter n=1 Tax=Tropicimonas omnivorans TaxID=3075590 RepID=A0ABU3DJW6_9RHOB|nr:biotin transporter BioY [Roseicyclus sp. F158]MDT0683985.1 biotin transporter BioY [Roseicyclus sp. F158]
MALAMTGRMTLAESIGPLEGREAQTKNVLLVAVGIVLLTVAAQIKLPVPPSPVAVNLGTFAVLTIGAAYGPRLGLTTILLYMAIGALGFDIFQSSTAEMNGVSYMMGTTGGYLVGYVLAVGAMGLLARRGWDRSPVKMVGAMLIGNAVIYLPGLAWLAVLIAGGMHQPEVYSSVFNQTLAWGALPFLVGDAMKLALAALLVPAAWKLLGRK